MVICRKLENCGEYTINKKRRQHAGETSPENPLSRNPQPTVEGHSFLIEEPATGSYNYRIPLASLCIPKWAWVKCRLHRKNKAYLVMPALPKEFIVTISWKYKSSQDRKMQWYLTEGWKKLAEQHQIEEGPKLRFTITGHKDDSVNISISKSHSA